MTLLDPVMKNGFAGLEISNVSIIKGEIRLQLVRKADAVATIADACLLPAWAQAPGMIVILPENAPAPECPQNAACGGTRERDLVLAWAACSSGNTATHSASEWISALAQRDHTGIWEAPGEPSTPAEPRKARAGLLTPIVSATGRDEAFVARRLLALALMITFVAAWILRWRMGSPAASKEPSSVSTFSDASAGWRRPGIFLGILLLLGIALRIHAAVTLPHDPDELLEGDYIRKILSDDHDSWVHPPLYRALHHAWSDFLGLSGGDPLWMWRIPSLTFSILALCFLAGALEAMKLPSRAELPFALAALSPIAVQDSVLARPYGLAMFGATLCLIAVSAREPTGDERDDWFSWFVALGALGLTLWADLVTALWAGSFVLARWLHRSSFSGRSMVTARIVIAVTVGVWAIPFACGLPGAVQASKELGWPFRAEPMAHSAFNQIDGFLWAMFGVFRYTSSPGPFLGLFALVMAGTLVAFAVKWTRTSAAVGLGVLLLLLALVSNRIGMRTRNVVFMPVAFSFVGSLLIAHRLRKRDRTP